jgi:D-tyrosyl-tRNA(Tyr) deacylase
MRAVIQRVTSASVKVGAEITGCIDRGLLVYVGAEAADTTEDLEWLASKLVNLRLFTTPHDPEAGMALSVKDIRGGILLVSQFTLFASTKKGTRPSWHRAAKPELARPLCDELVVRCSELLGRRVQTGRFGAMMQVTSVNDGPVTLLIDSKARE